MLWDDIFNAKPEHIRVSLQQRRQAILYDCNQHKIDTDSYSENNAWGAQLTFDYNFNEDLAELSESIDYPDERPVDE